MTLRFLRIGFCMASAWASEASSGEPGSGSIWDGGVTVNVLGHSGKMTLMNAAGNSVTIEMDSLHELDSAGSYVGRTGPNSGKHSRETFASVPFTIDDTLPRTEVNNVTCEQIDFHTTLVGSSSLEVCSHA